MTLPAEWVDKLEIREVLERYMRYNDDGALDRITALFEEEAIYQVAGRVLQGHDEIRAFLVEQAPYADGKPRWSEPGELLRQPRSVHVSSNPVIELDGDVAIAESDFVVMDRTDDGRARVMLVGRYRDRLRRSADGHWRFAHRTGVSVARPGEIGTDADWERVVPRMSEVERARLAR